MKNNNLFFIYFIKNENTLHKPPCGLVTEAVDSRQHTTSVECSIAPIGVEHPPQGLVHCQGYTPGLPRAAMGSKLVSVHVTGGSIRFPLRLNGLVFQKHVNGLMVTFQRKWIFQLRLESMFRFKMAANDFHGRIIEMREKSMKKFDFYYWIDWENFQIKYNIFYNTKV